MPRELLGYIGVDSGQVMIGDPCYMQDFEFNGVSDFSYDAACEASLSGGGMIGQFPRGDAFSAAVSDTGIGDGVFPVYRVTNRAGETTGILVKFQ